MEKKIGRIWNFLAVERKLERIEWEAVEFIIGMNFLAKKQDLRVIWMLV